MKEKHEKCLSVRGKKMGCPAVISGLRAQSRQQLSKPSVHPNSKSFLQKKQKEIILFKIVQGKKIAILLGIMTQGGNNRINRLFK